MPELEVISIAKTLDNIHTLDHISITLEKNELVVILGPSGCGKSTLFNIIAGLLIPDCGQVLISGQNWTGKTGRVGYMQQKDLLLPSRNILDNVTIPLLLKGMNKKRARSHAAGYFSDFGLAGFENYYPRQLSGGMRQRAALLRTYLFASDILLLDEPFASLDAISRRKMHLWLKNLRSRYQPSILFITHDIEEALMLADRIYVFSERPAHIKAEINVQLMPPEELMQCRQQIITLLE